MGTRYRARERQRNVACLSDRRRDASGCCRGLLCDQGSRFGGIEYIPLTNLIVIAPLHQIDMHVRIVIIVCPVAEHGRKTCTRAVPYLLAQRLGDRGTIQFNDGTICQLERAHVERISAAMLTDLRTRDTVTRTAIERIDTFDAAQRCAESGDRWRHVIGYPSRHSFAIGQRSVAGGAKPTRCLSGKSTASTLTTSVAMHSPGPVIAGDGSKTASSASRN